MRSKVSFHVCRYCITFFLSVFTLTSRALVEVDNTHTSSTENGIDRLREGSNKEKSPYTFSIKNGEATLTQFNGQSFGGIHYTGALTIPNTYEGCPVTSIRFNVFGYPNDLTSITIPDSVTSIGRYAFGKCKSLTSITIPNSVTNIASSAFIGCSGLTSIKIPNGITQIRPFTFASCYSLTTIIIPDSVTSIDGGAFAGCQGLTSIAIPQSVTNIDRTAFIACSSLANITVASDNPNYSSSDGVLFDKAKTKLIQYPVGQAGDYTIPNSVTKIDGGTFGSCSNLTSITIPDSVTSIGEGAFHGCSSLTNVTIPDSVTNIASSAFDGCSKLPDSVTQRIKSMTEKDLPQKKSILGARTLPPGLVRLGRGSVSPTKSPSKSKPEVPYSFTSENGKTTITGFNKSYIGELSITNSLGGFPVTSIGEFAFRECDGLTSVSIPKSVTNIGQRAFLGCSSLTNIVIPNSVISIGNSAFLSCHGLSRITIPNSVTNIGCYAFGSCSSLTRVSIPNSVTIIGDEPFSGCSSLTDIIVTADNPNYSSSDGVLFDKYQTKLIQCPNGKTGVYSIPNSIIRIGKNTFRGCSNLTSVTIPNSVTSIYDGTFSFCTSLTNVTIPNSVTSIGKEAFLGCSRLTCVAIPNSVTNIGSFAFDNNTKLTDTITSLSNPLLRERKVSQANDHHQLEHQLDYIPGLKRLGVSTKSTEATYTFASEDSKTAITGFNKDYVGALSITNTFDGFPVTNIREFAFRKCHDLTSVIIPDSVTNIGGWAFSECSSLTNLYFKGDAPKVDGDLKTDAPTTIYYLPETKGWGATFGGRPTKVWKQ